MWESFLEWGKDNLTHWTVMKAYVACAIAGGTVILGQTGLSIFGLGGDSDIDPDADVDVAEGADGLNFLSIRALAGFLTFFGLVGAAGTSSGWAGGVTVLAAFASGSMVMFMIAWTMRFFARMASSGTVDPDNAVGKTARVYLKIPAKGEGMGKITVSIQGRTAEYNATSAGAELPTGSECQVVRRTTADTFEVAPVD